jgi:prepilin-type N-terminal cleavage/methylation domain-containing protein
MTTSTLFLRPAAAGCRGQRTGFTLVEVMVAAGLSSLVLAAVLSALLFITRSSLQVTRYAQMEAELRVGLERFAADAREARDVRWHHSQRLTLFTTDGAVDYGFDREEGKNSGIFYRECGDGRQVLVRQVSPEFGFRRYKLDLPNSRDNPAANDRETRLVQILIPVVNAGPGGGVASQVVVSSRYLLRNKPRGT